MSTSDTLIVLDAGPLQGIYSTHDIFESCANFWLSHGALFTRSHETGNVERFPYTGVVSAGDGRRSLALVFWYGLLEKATEGEEVVFEAEFCGNLPDYIHTIAQIPEFACLKEIPSTLDV